MTVSEKLRGPWPDVRPLIRDELHAYLADATAPGIQALPTRCPPWTVRDVTAHLAATFRRFNTMLAQGRGGDLSPPFGRDELSEENIRAVRAFTGDPLASLRREASAFVTAASDLEEVMPHQFGPIPVGLQLGFGLNELAVHHDDIAHAQGGSYRPGDPAVSAIAIVWTRALGGLPPGDDPWPAILAASGRGS